MQKYILEMLDKSKDLESQKVYLLLYSQNNKSNTKVHYNQHIAELDNKRGKSKSIRMNSGHVITNLRKQMMTRHN